MSAGVALRNLDSANPREIRAQQKAVSVAAKMGGHSERDEGSQVPQWKSREPMCQRI